MSFLKNYLFYRKARDGSSRVIFWLVLNWLQSHAVVFAEDHCLESKPPGDPPCPHRLLREIRARTCFSPSPLVAVISSPVKYHFPHKQPQNCKTSCRYTCLLSRRRQCYCRNVVFSAFQLPYCVTSGLFYFHAPLSYFMYSGYFVFLSFFLFLFVCVSNLSYLCD